MSQPWRMLLTRSQLAAHPSPQSFKQTYRTQTSLFPRNFNQTCKTQSRLCRTQFRPGQHRPYTSRPNVTPSSRTPWILSGLLLVGGGLGYIFWLQNNQLKPVGTDNDKDRANYQKVYDEIALQLEEKDEHDDGSFGPVLVRLSWHTSGTYDKETNTGGSNGATMRFAPEGSQSANAGLVYARDFLEPIKREAWTASPWNILTDI